MVWLRENMIAFKNTLIINLKTGLIDGISEDHCYVTLWLEVVAVVGVGRRIRPVKVGKTWEKQLWPEVFKLEVLRVVEIRDVAAIRVWYEGCVGAGKDQGKILVDNLGAPGERHHAVHHRGDPQQQGESDLPKATLAQLLEACVVVHPLRQKLWN